MNKLIEFSNQFDTVTYERMINENDLHTLKERIAFEHEYHQRRQEEVAYLEKIQLDLNKDFQQNEFHQIIERIRSVLIIDLSLSLTFFFFLSISARIIKNSMPFVSLN